ncbi:MAG: putative nucleotidyltransferase substrate binding domain-containing protein, partial [bacterium]
CGLVYAHGPPEPFLALAAKITAGLNACGFSARPAPAVSSLADWKAFYSEIITDPIVNAVYESRSRFDLLAACGNPSLAADLQGHISAEIARCPVLIAVLANDSMVNLPPLTFFQDLVVELDGARTQTLDIRRTALDPLVDVGRVFGLARQEIAVTATLERLARAGESLPDHEALFRAAAEAFRVALYQQGHAGLREASDGLNIRPAMLSRVDRQLLKSAFRSIHQLLEFTWMHQDSIARL